MTLAVVDVAGELYFPLRPLPPNVLLLLVDTSRADRLGGCGCGCALVRQLS